MTGGLCHLFVHINAHICNQWWTVDGPQAGMTKPASALYFGSSSSYTYVYIIYTHIHLIDTYFLIIHLFIHLYMYIHIYIYIYLYIYMLSFLTSHATLPHKKHKHHPSTARRQGRLLFSLISFLISGRKPWQIQRNPAVQNGCLATQRPSDGECVWRESSGAGAAGEPGLIPSGNLLHNYGKSQFLLGQLTINGNVQ